MDDAMPRYWRGIETEYRYRADTTIYRTIDRVERAYGTGPIREQWEKRKEPAP